MPGEAEALREELRQIGQRRLAHVAAGVELVEETRSAISKAKGKVSMTEVAELVELERASMYHTYIRA